MARFTQLKGGKHGARIQAGLLLSASPKSSSNNLVDGAILEQLAESF